MKFWKQTIEGDYECSSFHIYAITDGREPAIFDSSNFSYFNQSDSIKDMGEITQEELDILLKFTSKDEIYDFIKSRPEETIITYKCGCETTNGEYTKVCNEHNLCIEVGDPL